MLAEGVMMSYLFNGKTVRVFLHKSALWFVLGDVGKALGISNIRELARKILTNDERIHISKHYDENCRAWMATVRIPDSTRKNCPNLAAVNESGLYTLIMRSTKPEAIRFRHWVTGEVIPEIMRTGQYTYKSHSSIPALSSLRPVRDVAKTTSTKRSIVKDGTAIKDNLTISLNVTTHEGRLSAMMSFRQGTKISSIDKWRKDLGELVDRLQNNA